MDWNISNLLWFLVTGALFYWMMRKGGCGMHGSRSHGAGSHGAQQQGESESSGHQARTGSVRDPVCGMQVDPERPAGMRNINGQNYFLCSTNCLEKFDKEPERYASEARAPESRTHGHQRQAGCH